MNNDVLMTGHVTIYNDDEGYAEQDAPPAAITVNPFEKQQRYPFPRMGGATGSGPGANGEVGIDVVVLVNVSDQNPGWVQARIFTYLYESVANSIPAGGQDLDGSAASDWFAIAPNTSETRRVTVNNTDEGGDWANIDMTLLNTYR